MKIMKLDGTNFSMGIKFYYFILKTPTGYKIYYNNICIFYKLYWINPSQIIENQKIENKLKFSKNIYTHFY